jgi:hypothetical protein
MHKIQVGQPLVAGKTHWPECVEFNLYDNSLELRLFFGRPSKAEIRGVQDGACSFGFLTSGDVLFFLYRFAGVSWSDVPYSWHLVPPERRVFPAMPDTGETRGLLQVILIDAETGIVQALRAVTLGRDFTRLFLRAIRAQASMSWCGQAEYDRQLAAVYQRYPTTDKLLAAARAQTNGGA